MNGHDSTVNPPTEGKAKSPRKAKAKPASEGKGKRSLNISLPMEDYERFALHALKLTNGNISELIAQLGRQHLRDFHITRTPNREGGE